MKYKLLALPLLFVAMQACGQNFVVFSIRGNVQCIRGGRQQALAIRDTVRASDILDIPVRGALVLVDEEKGIQMSLDKPGRATAKSMAVADKNSVTSISKRYLSFISSQLNGREYRQVRNCSDPATVTRALKIAGAEKATDAYEDFRIAFNGDEEGLEGNEEDALGQASRKMREAFDRERQAIREEFQRERETMYEEFESFRRESMEQYLAFMCNPWEETATAEDPQPRKERTVPPVTIGNKDLEKPVGNNEIAVGKVLQPLTIPPQPLPPGRIREVTDKECQMVAFSFYGTEDKVRFNQGKAPRLNDVTETEIARFLKSLTASRYDNLLVDCLTLRSKYNLSDWAYLQMLKSLAGTCYGEGSNESILLMAYLYCQSGYKMRLGHDRKRLYMLYASDYHLFNQPYIEIEGFKYYGVDPLPQRLFACRANYPREAQLTLNILRRQSFAMNATDERTIVSERYPDMGIHTSVNANLLDFYTSFPNCYDGRDMMSRWAMYANTPMQSELAETLYPQLRHHLEGLSQLEQVERILNLVQTGLEYEYDDVVWGEDRVFFPEESLFYPYCDCEDRSILLTRMVRDLLGLRCLLVHYPGHLATAIHFDEDVPGDYISYEGEKFTVCDPTYIGARVGRTMPDMDNAEAEIILLDARQSEQNGI